MSVGMRLDSVTVGGIAHSVYRWGDGKAPVVFMLHGWGDTGRTFELLVHALSPDWQVMAWDWRGFGTSEWSPASYFFPDYLADLDQLLQHFTPAQPARLLGHSMGGNIASLYAGSRPERVSALLNLEGFGLRDSDPAAAPGRYAQWLDQQRVDPRPTTFASFDELAEKIRARHPTLSQQLARFGARHWARQVGDRVMLRADPKHRRVNPVLYRRAEALACWRSVRAPVLLLAGELSPFARVGNRALDPDDGLDTYPHSERVIIEGCGHMLHWEAPAEVAQHARAFFASVAERRRRP